MPLVPRSARWQIERIYLFTRYQFWRVNHNAFASSFYLQGYAGWAIRLVHWLIWTTGRSKDVKQLCEAKTISEQDVIWRRSLRSIFVDGSVVQKLVNNPIFLWNALGISKHFLGATGRI